MDPNEAYKRLLEAVVYNLRAEYREHAEALVGWFTRGGFRPAGWSGVDYFDELLAPYHTGKGWPDPWRALAELDRIKARQQAAR